MSKEAMQPRHGVMEGEGAHNKYAKLPAEPALAVRC
jgi:hypothetical protein